MRTFFSPRRLATAALTLSATLPAMAQIVIAPGTSVSGIVQGTTSIYQVFGHSGTVEASQAAGTTDAPYVTFSSGNVFTFSEVTGGTNCCSNPGDLFPPDGAGGGTDVIGINGLSNTQGNFRLALLGVFTSDVDPYGGTAPATLPADMFSPVSLAPALNQVFYIGDGLTGYNDAAGSPLSFIAPTGATRLYVGLADAWSFGGLSSWYQDNPGSISYKVTMAPVPEADGGVLALAGLGVLAILRRRRG